MTKEDLRDGMVIETNNDNRYLILDNATVGMRAEGFIDLDSFNNDLTCVVAKNYTIRKVYKPTLVGGLTRLLENPKNLIWQRPEEPQYYNGKVVCVETVGKGLTVGKIYKFVDGESKADKGNPMTNRKVVSCEDLNSLFDLSKFIEVVE